MNPSQAKYNAKIAEQARKRRAMFYRLHLQGISIADLARKNGMTYQCMSVMMRRAKKDLL